MDANSLAVIDRKRAHPKLDSLCGIDDAPGQTLMLAAERHQSEFAVAVGDPQGRASTRFSPSDLGESLAAVTQARAWPEENRLYARFATRDPFDPGKIHQDPSLLVIREGRVSFASSELRRRFAPLARLSLDHAWTLDRTAGRLWFAARSTEEGQPTAALLLGVNARTLRADAPVEVPDVAAILALHPVPDGAIALVKLTAGGMGLTRARMTAGGLSLTTQRLPL